MKLEEVLAFVKRHNLMTLATVDEAGKPEAAVVEFGEMDDFTIILDTLNTSRKYRNLQTKSDVAIVIGWDESITVQLEGTARELSGEELAAAKEVYFAKNPRARKWADKPEIAYFAVKPAWVRYSDLNHHPWLVKEFTL